MVLGTDHIPESEHNFVFLSFLSLGLDIVGLLMIGSVMGLLIRLGELKLIPTPGVILKIS